MNESTPLSIFKAKVELAVGNIKTLDQFRQSDEMVDYVLKIGKSLMTKPLDTMPPDYLLQVGGKLAGAYSYLGQMSARARAERDVYDQKASEVEKALLLQHFGDKYKVTEARSLVSSEMGDIREVCIIKDADKNQWENITEACEKMLSFVQSAIKVKEGERYQSTRVQNQHG